MTVGLSLGVSTPISSNRDAVNEIFKQFDTDKSGGLNLKEAIRSGAPDEETFRKADADGNGSVSKEELVTFFDSLDKEISSGEMAPKDLVSALRNGGNDIIELLKQAQRDNDQKSVKSMLDSLVAKNEDREVQLGSLVNLKT